MLKRTVMSSLSSACPPSPSLSPQLDHGGHGAVAERVGGAATVREELPGLPGHGEHLTSVSTAQLDRYIPHRSSAARPVH